MSSFSPGAASKPRAVPTHVRLRQEAAELRSVVDARAAKVPWTPSSYSHASIPLPKPRFSFAPPPAPAGVSSQVESPSSIAHPTQSHPLGPTVPASSVPRPRLLAGQSALPGSPPSFVPPDVVGSLVALQKGKPSIGMRSPPPPSFFAKQLHGASSPSSACEAHGVVDATRIDLHAQGSQPRSFRAHSPLLTGIHSSVAPSIPSPTPPRQLQSLSSVPSPPEDPYGVAIARPLAELPATSRLRKREDVGDDAVIELLTLRRAILRGCYGSTVVRALAEGGGDGKANRGGEGQADGGKGEVGLLRAGEGRAPTLHGGVSGRAGVIGGDDGNTVEGGWEGHDVRGFRRAPPTAPIFRDAALDHQRKEAIKEEEASALLVCAVREAAESAASHQRALANSRLDAALRKVGGGRGVSQDGGGSIRSLLGAPSPDIAAKVRASLAPAVASLMGSVSGVVKPSDRVIGQSERDTILDSIDAALRQPLGAPSEAPLRTSNSVAARDLIRGGDWRVSVGGSGGGAALDDGKWGVGSAVEGGRRGGKFLAERAAQLAEAAVDRESAIRAHADVLVARAMLAERATRGAGDAPLDSEMSVVAAGLSQLPVIDDLGGALGVDPSHLVALISRALCDDAKGQDAVVAAEAAAAAADAEVNGDLHGGETAGDSQGPRKGPAWRLPTLRAAARRDEGPPAGDAVELRTKLFGHEQTIRSLEAQLSDAQSALAALAAHGGDRDASRNVPLRNRSEAIAQQLEMSLQHVLRVLQAAPPGMSGRISELAGDVCRSLGERGLTVGEGEGVDPDEDGAPTGEVTLVFTDVQSSTKLWDTFGEKFTESLEMHDAFLRQSMLSHAGYEVKTEGDSFMVAFSTAKDAAHWMVDVQFGLTTLPWPEELLDVTAAGVDEVVDGQRIWRGLRVRMGAHTGTPICQRNPLTRRMDYFGPAVNAAARVQSQAFGGQLFISAAFADSICEAELGTPCGPHDTELPIAFSHTLRRHGSHRLKGIKEPVAILELVPDIFKGRNFPLLNDKQASDRAAAKESIDTLLANNPRLIPTYQKCARVLQGTFRIFYAKIERERRRRGKVLADVLQRFCRCFISKVCASSRFHMAEVVQRNEVKVSERSARETLSQLVERAFRKQLRRGPSAFVVQSFARSFQSAVLVAARRRRAVAKRSATLVQAFARARLTWSSVQQRQRTLKTFRSLRTIQAWMRSTAAMRLVFRRFATRNPKAAVMARRAWTKAKSDRGSKSSKASEYAPSEGRAASERSIGMGRAPSEGVPDRVSQRAASEAQSDTSLNESKSLNASTALNATVDSVRDRVAAARARRLGDTLGVRVTDGKNSEPAGGRKLSTNPVGEDAVTRLADRRARNAERLEKLRKQGQGMQDSSGGAAAAPSARERLAATIAKRRAASEAANSESGQSDTGSVSQRVGKPTDADADKGAESATATDSDAGSLSRSERLKQLQARRRAAKTAVPDT